MKVEYVIRNPSSMYVNTQLQRFRRERIMAVVMMIVVLCCISSLNINKLYRENPSFPQTLSPTSTSIEYRKVVCGSHSVIKVSDELD